MKNYANKQNCRYTTTIQTKKTNNNVMKNDCQFDLMKIGYVDLNMLNATYDFQHSRIVKKIIIIK
jgi:hypothetical protein